MISENAGHNLPSGRLLPEEEWTDGAARKLYEETGFAIASEQLCDLPDCELQVVPDAGDMDMKWYRVQVTDAMMQKNDRPRAYDWTWWNWDVDGATAPSALAYPDQRPLRGEDEVLHHHLHDMFE